MPVRKSFKQVRLFNEIMLYNICNLNSISARQAQEPMDNLSAQSMDQERFEGDNLCRIRLQIASLYYIVKERHATGSFDYIIPKI